MDGGWRAEPGKCPCGEGKKYTNMTCDDPKPQNGGSNCSCSELQNTAHCDNKTAQVEESCENPDCSGTSTCTDAHNKLL